ncbi:B-cell receptor CD22-like [Siphateles boraxobius]|uniref:B-cell receptor CD22-like n=1 Tax=Siphateles boraxobius TaxID=180520 RepID=UPI0040646459
MLRMEEDKDLFVGQNIKVLDHLFSLSILLLISDNPCKVQVEPSELKNPLKESEEFTAKCSTFSSCLKYPEWFVHTSGQKEEWLSSSLTDVIIENEEENDRKVTKIKFNVTWKDDKRILSCRPAQAQDIFQIRNITLSVEYAPRETTAKGSSEYVKEGDSVTLSCESRGRPDVTFSWFKKDNIEQSQQMSDFKLNNVKPEDSGEYYCGAKNKHGAMTSNTIIIDVKYGPKGVTVKHLFSVEDLKEGDALILKCSINDSNPLVKKFEWYNNYKMSQQTSDTLTISNVTADDGGSYYCQADNVDPLTHRSAPPSLSATDSAKPHPPCHIHPPPDSGRGAIRSAASPPLVLERKSSHSHLCTP